MAAGALFVAILSFIQYTSLLMVALSNRLRNPQRRHKRCQVVENIIRGGFGGFYVFSSRNTREQQRGRDSCSSAKEDVGLQPVAYAEHLFGGKFQQVERHLGHVPLRLPYDDGCDSRAGLYSRYNAPRARPLLTTFDRQGSISVGGDEVRSPPDSGTGPLQGIVAELQVEADDYEIGLPAVRSESRRACDCGKQTGGTYYRHTTTFRVMLLHVNSRRARRGENGF